MHGRRLPISSDITSRSRRLRRPSRIPWPWSTPIRIILTRKGEASSSDIRRAGAFCWCRSHIAGVVFGSSALGSPPGVSVSNMKKMPTRSEADEMRPEYDFDYSKARPNPYAARLKGHSVAVLLAPDVAPSFPTAESVNDILRAVINAVPRPRRRVARLKAHHPRKAG